MARAPGMSGALDDERWVVGDMAGDQGEWRVAQESVINMKTSRIGLFSVHAKAPVVDGTAQISDGEVTLEFIVAIDQVRTGNPILDPEVHALVNSTSDGRLTFSGTGASLAEVNGHASAGTITVPLELVADPDSNDVDDALGLQLRGRTTFTDIHLPLPGMGHIKHLDIDIDGLITLMRATVDGQ